MVGYWVVLVMSDTRRVAPESFIDGVACFSYILYMAFIAGQYIYSSHGLAGVISHD